MFSSRYREYDGYPVIRSTFTDGIQEKKYIKLSNVARSISEISPQASLFVPMTLPSSMLPSYVTIDLKSQWHVGGLLSTAYETMTLPSRLRLHNNSRASMDQLVNVLNVNGNQNISKFQMSIDQKAQPNGDHREARQEITDARLPSQERRDDEEPWAVRSEELNTFDMDFFPAEAGEQIRDRQAVKSPHVFGQVETYRASDQKESADESTEEGEAGHERARRRAAGLPIIQK